MAAPSTAYAIKDGNFVKAVIRNGSTPYYVYVAKFLSGAQSDGGYSTASTTMRSNIKSLFRLDELVDVREKQEDGSVKVVGFVGCVRHGSANAAFHASKRVSGARVRGDDGDEYDVLNDAGLNRLPQVSGTTVEYAFANYYKVSWEVTSAFYDSSSYVSTMTIPGQTSAHRTLSGTVKSKASAAVTFVNRGGLGAFDEPGTVTFRMEATNGEGTRTYTSNVSFLGLLNFGPFCPVNSFSDQPNNNDPGIMSFIVDHKLMVDMATSLADNTAPSQPEAIPVTGDNNKVMLLGEGAVSGEVQDEDIKAYYNAVRTGAGNFPKPDDGYWVGIDPVTVSMEMIYVGVRIQNGLITSMFRARTPTAIKPKLTLTINVTLLSEGGTGEASEYSVSLGLTAEDRTPGAANVTISALYVRKTQGGAAEQGQFLNGDGSIFTGTTLTLPTGSGVTQAKMVKLVTALATPFWVTANATCDNGSYQFVNNGGSTSESSGGTQPGPTPVS